MDQNMIRKMQKMQKELQEKQEEFMEREFSFSKHGVHVSAKGSKKITSIEIEDKDLLDPEDPEILQDVILLVINELFETIDNELAAIMPAMPGGLGF
ncbi:YbaB/EbfC family nucleoid-associated protein [Mycoplasmopsis primatum]|uniref:YbaB/EbfC family nucleoid-associated protein n=1 Tax=Mycoplasmopsis primatum TaxID=55604 RepID=UPI0004965B42|nr:YbaB/EbfC family nucleoid-associated protein [Mycoplasmopsis primatum]